MIWSDRPPASDVVATEAIASYAASVLKVFIDYRSFPKFQFTKLTPEGFSKNGPYVKRTARRLASNAANVT
ncbi:hypothetical protein [Yoonia sp.]|uniref:hypothetical protein n=1 Tax=Yoonia sp. TaxID=2212373 RepID=UPI002FD920B2